jgi:AraC-like DNA-binding protein
VEQLEQQAQLPLPPPSSIEQLLAEHCVGTQLYLQHDLTSSQLALAIGTNRTYLSQYFSSQGITYNVYINELRINHFMNIYREAVAAQKTITAQQLAKDSGYRSYSTFSLAFKQRTGQTVTNWMRDLQNSSPAGWLGMKGL